MFLELKKYKSKKSIYRKTFYIFSNDVLNDFENMLSEFVNSNWFVYTIKNKVYLDSKYKWNDEIREHINYHLQTKYDMEYEQIQALCKLFIYENKKKQTQNLNKKITTNN